MLEFLDPILRSLWQCRGCLDGLCIDLCNKSCIDVYEAGYGREIRVHKEKPILSILP